MSAARTLKQRAVLRRRPRTFAIGTTRTWQGGTFVKVGRDRWERRRAASGGSQVTPKKILAALPKAAAKDRGGLAELTRSLAIANASQSTWVSKLAGYAAASLAAPRETMVLMLPSALAALMTMGSPDMTWQLYCARRWAEFNGGTVDMTGLPAYVESAVQYHAGTVPEAFVRKAGGYTGPRTVADVNLASWMQYFAEGGQLNQPTWLETNRFKDLRRQFELLANMHGGH